MRILQRICIGSSPSSPKTTTLEQFLFKPNRPGPRVRVFIPTAPNWDMLGSTFAKMEPQPTKEKNCSQKLNSVGTN